MAELSTAERAELRIDALRLYAVHTNLEIGGSSDEEMLRELKEATEPDFTEVRDCGDHWYLVIHPVTQQMAYPTTLYVFCDIFLQAKRQQVKKTMEIKLMVAAFDTEVWVAYDKYAKVNQSGEEGR